MDFSDNKSATICRKFVVDSRYTCPLTVEELFLIISKLTNLRSAC